MLALFLFSTLLVIFSAVKLKDDYLHPLFGGLFLLYLYGVGGVGITNLIGEEFLSNYTSDEVFIASFYGSLCMLLYACGYFIGSKRIIAFSKVPNIVLNRGGYVLAYTLLAIGFISGIYAMKYFAGSIAEFLANTHLRQSNSPGKTWILFFLIAAKWGAFVLLVMPPWKNPRLGKWFNFLICAAILALFLLWGRLFVLVYLVQIIILILVYRKLSLKRAALAGISIFFVIFVAGVQRWMQGIEDAKNIVGFAETLDYALNNINYVPLLLNNFFDGWYVFMGYVAASLRNDWTMWGGLALGSFFKIIPGMYSKYSDVFLTETNRVLNDTYTVGERASNLMGELFIDYHFLGALVFLLAGYYIAFLYKKERGEKLFSLRNQDSRLWSLLYAVVLANFAISIRTGLAAGLTWLFVDLCWLAIWVVLHGRRNNAVQVPDSSST